MSNHATLLHFTFFFSRAYHQPFAFLHLCISIIIFMHASIHSFIHFLLLGPIPFLPLSERQLPETLGHLHPSLIRKPCRMIGHSIRRNWPITKCTKIALLAFYTTPFIHLRPSQTLESYFKPSSLILHRRQILSVFSIQKKGPP